MIPVKNHFDFKLSPGQQITFDYNYIPVYYSGKRYLLRGYSAGYCEKESMAFLVYGSTELLVVPLEEVMVLDPNNPVEKILYGV